MLKLYSKKLVTLSIGLIFVGAQCCQRQEIETYLEKAGEDIKSAKKYGKSTATCSYIRWIGYEPVTEYAYDAIPFEFFERPELIPYDQVETAEAIEYRENAKTLFKNKILGDKTEINNSDFARFFHRFAVKKMSLTKVEKKLLKKDPIKLEECVRARKQDEPEAEIKIDKKEYRLYVLLNYVIKCDLEKEFEVLKK
jgi:hypothetical protein